MLDVDITKISADETIVNRESFAYKLIVDSLKKRGFLGAIIVRAVEDGYIVVDGVHRYAAAKDAGITTIPCIVTEDDPILHNIKV